MANIKRKTILIDLDGVLNTYKGDFDENFIPNIREGAKEFISELSEKYNITLFTTRKKELALEWLKNNQFDTCIQKVTNTKEACYLYIDDRCIRFNGDFLKLKTDIDNFQVWWMN